MTEPEEVSQVARRVAEKIKGRVTYQRWRMCHGPCCLGLSLPPEMWESSRSAYCIECDARLVVSELETSLVLARRAYGAAGARKRQIWMRNKDREARARAAAGDKS